MKITEFSYRFFILSYAEDCFYLKVSWDGCFQAYVTLGRKSRVTWAEGFSSGVNKESATGNLTWSVSHQTYEKRKLKWADAKGEHPF